MRFNGLMTLDVQGDAGVGRRIWLAQNILPEETVVDLGGTGGMLADWHPHLTAFDDLSGFGPGHRIHAPVFKRGDVQTLPFADDEFDVAVLAEVLEHVPDPVRALAEAGRVAKRVLITTPFENRWQNGIAFRISGHIRFFTPEIFTTKLRKAGLDGDVAVLEFGGWSFLVACVASVLKAGALPTDRFSTFASLPSANAEPPAEPNRETLRAVTTPPPIGPAPDNGTVDTLIVLPTTGRTVEQAKAAVELVIRYAQVPAQLLVVLDEGTDADEAWFAERGAIVSRSTFRRGLVEAYNVGYRTFLANPWFTYLHVLEDNVHVSADWDLVLRRTLQAHPEFGWVACGQLENARAPFTSLCSLMSRACAERVTLVGIGCLDPTFAPEQFDDGDLYMRIRVAGFTPHGVRHLVSHPESRTSRTRTEHEDVQLMLAHRTIFAERWGIPDMRWDMVPVHAACEACGKIEAVA